MPIDPTIAAGVAPIQPQNNALLAQGVRPVELRDPLEQYANAQRAMALGAQNQMTQLEIGKMNALNKAFAQPGVLGADGSIDPNALVSSLGANGGGAAVPEVLPKIQEYKKSVAEMQQAQVKTATDRLGNYMQVYAHVDPKDPNSLQTAIGIHNAMHKDPITGPFLNSLGAEPDGGVQRITDLYNLSKNWDPKNGPSPWESFLQTQAMTPEQMFKLERPTTVDQGGQVSVIQGHAYGAPRTQVVGVFGKDVSPDTVYKGNIDLSTNAATNRTKIATTGMEVGGAQQRELVKAADEQLKPLFGAAQTARAAVAQGNHIIDLVNEPGITLGAGAEWRAALQNWAKTMGIPGAGNISDSQQLYKLLAQNTMEQASNMGTKMRQLAKPELDALKVSNANQNMTPEAIRAVVRLQNLMWNYRVNLFNSTLQQRAQGLPQLGAIYQPIPAIPKDIRPEDLNGGASPNDPDALFGKYGLKRH